MLVTSSDEFSCVRPLIWLSIINPIVNWNLHDAIFAIVIGRIWMFIPRELAIRYRRIQNFWDGKVSSDFCHLFCYISPFIWRRQPPLRLRFLERFPLIEAPARFDPVPWRMSCAVFLFTNLLHTCSTRVWSISPPLHSSLCYRRDSLLLLLNLGSDGQHEVSMLALRKC